MALPGNGSILATDPARDELFKEAGRRIVDLVKRKDIKPRDILTRKAFENAFALDVAMGGSTNTVLHTLAWRSRRAAVPDLAHLNEVSGPRAVSVQGRAEPGSITWKMSIPRGRDQRDSEDAGRESRARCQLDCITVTGKTLGENISATLIVKDADVIRPLTMRTAKTGGLAVLFGNSRAQRVAVLKTGAVSAASMQQFTGPAVIFESERGIG